MIPVLMKRLYGWLQGHRLGVLLTSLTLGFGALTFFVQVWHGQASQSAAIYETYETSNAIASIDKISVLFDEAVKFRGDTPAHEKYIPVLWSIKDADNNLVTSHVARFSRIMQTVAQCYYDTFPKLPYLSWMSVEFLTGCHQRVTKMLLKEHIVDSFFTVRTYIYCDPEIYDYFKANLLLIEDLMVELVAAESNLKRSRVFLDQAQHDKAVRAGRINKDDDKYRVIRVPLDRCNEFYSLKPGQKAPIEEDIPKLTGS